MNDKQLALRIGEVAELLSCSRAKAYAMASAGQIPVVEVGGLKRVPRAALEKLLADKLREARGGHGDER